MACIHSSHSVHGMLCFLTFPFCSWSFFPLPPPPPRGHSHGHVTHAEKQLCVCYSSRNEERPEVQFLPFWCCSAEGRGWFRRLFHPYSHPLTAMALLCMDPATGGNDLSKFLRGLWGWKGRQEFFWASGAGFMPRCSGDGNSEKVGLAWLLNGFCKLPPPRPIRSSSLQIQSRAPEEDLVIPTGRRRPSAGPAGASAVR